MEIKAYIIVPIEKDEPEDSFKLKSIINETINNSLIPLWKQIYLCEKFNVNYEICVENKTEVNGDTSIIYKKFGIMSESKN